VTIVNDDSKPVPADPRLWSEKSQRSVCVEWTTEYRDIYYKCWHCQTDAVFTALQQKYNYEIKKVHIAQNRCLCEACWRESNRIARELAHHGEQWAIAKAKLRADAAFLQSWLALLTRARMYSSREDVAKRRMVEKLLERCSA
jgi:hypothetical protein